MATIEGLMEIVGARTDAANVQAISAADNLTLSTEPDLEEGEPLRSYLSNPAIGYQLMCVEGIVATVFVYVVPSEGFNAYSGSLPGGISALAIRSDVRGRFGVPQRTGEAVSIAGLGRQGAWDRFDLGSVYVHFEYNEPEQRIRLVSLMAPGWAT
jgi:hypothetical protein